MRDDLTIRVPMAPPRELSPNASIKLPARAKNGYRRQWQQAWHAAIVDARNRIRPYPPTPVYSGLVFCAITYARPKGGKPWDEDNLLATMKHGLDQLQKDGIVSNDRHLRYVIEEQIMDPDGRGYVEVTLAEVTR